MYIREVNKKNKEEGVRSTGGATLWQSSANALPVYRHALPVALPVF